MAQPLSYRNERRRVLPLRVIIAATAMIGAIAVILSLDGVPVRHKKEFVCALCGSGRTRTDWMIGFSTADRTRPNQLDRWLRDHRGGHEHDWQLARHQPVDLFDIASKNVPVPGRPLPFGWIVAGHGWLDRFVAASTDEEIAAFVDAIGATDAAEREHAIHVAMERLSALARRVPPPATTRDTAPAAP